jgi:hypothetical protein
LLLPGRESGSGLLAARRRDYDDAPQRNANPLACTTGMAYYRDTQFDDVLLEPEQKSLLETLVEASRRTPREKRQKFMVYRTMGRHLSSVMHPSLPKDFEGAFEGDFEALANEGMLTATYGSHGTPNYDITPRGYKYYEHLQLEKG